MTEWIWLAIGAIICAAALQNRSDRWRNMAFGLGIMAYVCADKLSPPVPVNNPLDVGILRLIGFYLEAAGFAVAFPCVANGRFQADRDLAQQFSLACLAASFAFLPLYLASRGNNPGHLWLWALLPVPACAWIASVVARWMGRNKKVFLF